MYRWIRSNAPLLLIVLGFTCLAVAQASGELGQKFATGRKLEASEPLTPPADPNRRMTAGTIIGVVFAAILAGLLVLVVILAICVPGIREKIGRTGISHGPTTRGPTSPRANREPGSKGESTGWTPSVRPVGNHSSASPRNDSTSSSSVDSAEAAALRVIARKRTQSMSISEPEAPEHNSDSSTGSDD